MMRIPVDERLWLQETAAKAMENRNGKNAKAVCEDFEAYFLSSLLNQLRKTTAFSEKSQAEQIYFSMFNDKIAEVIAKKGIGIKDVLMHYVERTKNAKVSGENGDNS